MSGNNELTAGPISLVQLFKGEKLYVSPLFQRQFVWQKDSIDALWDGIDEIYNTEATTRFLGAIVFEVKSAGLAFQPDSTYIVDGQQRITTLYMVLLNFAIEAERNKCEHLAESLYKQYLFNQDGEYMNTPKISPTLLDLAQFNELFNKVKIREPKLTPSFGNPKGLMHEACKIISQCIKDRCFTNKAFDEEKATKYLKIIIESLKFVQIGLGEYQDPHQVFDSLNAQGVRLENKDLIRNLVFQKAGTKDADHADHIYRTQWLPLETTLENRFDGYFFPFALVHKSTITKSTLLSALKEKWKDLDPNEIIKSIERYVPIYNALTSLNSSTRDIISRSSIVNRQFHRFANMKLPSSTYPFIFCLMDAFFREELQEDVVFKNLLLIESFLVRRAFAGQEPTGLHAVFKGLWNDTKGDLKLFISIIDKLPTVEFPNDKQFSDDIRLKPLYKRKLMHYILLEYENALDGGDPSDYQDCTVDHVMPQELPQSWEAVISSERHLALKNTWANLVPLTGPANSQKGNNILDSPPTAG